MTKAALWLRVSTDEQDTDNQRRQLIEFAENRGFEIVHEYDITGVSAYRGGLDTYITHAVRDARNGKYKVLLIWSLDRLCREGIAKTLSVIQRFQSVGCGIVSYQELEIDTTGPHGEFLVSVWAHLANLESARRSERTKAGVERARANGKRIGRPPGSKDTKRRKRSGYFARYA